MKTKEEINKALLALLTAISAADDMGAPEGILYAGLMTAGYDHADYSFLRALLLKGALIRSTGANCFGLTTKGRQVIEQAEQFNAAK